MTNLDQNGRRGRLITLEGLEGAGKSSLIPHLARVLEDKGLRLTVTREPGGTVLGEKVRELLLDPESAVCADAELCLVFAARAQHLYEIIVPALERGEWVLCDRFTEASYAYQGGGRQMDLSRIASLEQLVQGDLRPDLTILVDLEPAVGLDRTRGRAFQDRFEAEEMDFFERARAAYLRHCHSHRERMVTVDGAQSQEQVRAAAVALLNSWVEPWL